MQVKSMAFLFVILIGTSLAQAGVTWIGPDGTMPRLDEHEVIFLGELTGVDYKRDDCDEKSRCRFDYSFRVLKTYKGKLETMVVLRLAYYANIMAQPREVIGGVYLMYADHRDTKAGRFLIFDRSSTSPSFIFTRVRIEDWGNDLPRFSELQDFWASGLGSWLNAHSIKVNEPKDLVHISRDEVVRVVARMRHRLIRCYSGNFRVLKSGPVAFNVTVFESGKVKSVETTTKSQAKAADTSIACLLENLEGWSFPHGTSKEAAFRIVFD
jgi:hypothetical protein